MNIVTKIAALAILATTLAAGGYTPSAEAKGFHRGGHGGHHFRFQGHRFGFGHHSCWKFGKWVCGSGSGY